MNETQAAELIALVERLGFLTQVLAIVCCLQWGFQVWRVISISRNQSRWQ